MPRAFRLLWLRYCVSFFTRKAESRYNERTRNCRFPRATPPPPGRKTPTDKVTSACAQLPKGHCCLTQQSLQWCKHNPGCSYLLSWSKYALRTQVRPKGPSGVDFLSSWFVGWSQRAIGHYFHCITELQNGHYESYNSWDIAGYVKCPTVYKQAVYCSAAASGTIWHVPCLFQVAWPWVRCSSLWLVIFNGSVILRNKERLLLEKLEYLDTLTKFQNRDSPPTCSVSSILCNCLHWNLVYWAVGDLWGFQQSVLFRMPSSLFCKSQMVRYMHVYAVM